MHSIKTAINVLYANAVIYIAIYSHSSMTMEAEIRFETMVSFHQTTRRHIPEYSNPTETLKSKNSWISLRLLLDQERSAVCCGDLFDICP